jgi:hypothetical protein
LFRVKSERMVEYMKAHKIEVPYNGQHREISEKEMNEITKAVGEQARAQTVELKAKRKETLRKELASARAAFLANGKKRSKA